MISFVTGNDITKVSTLQGSGPLVPYADCELILISLIAYKELQNNHGQYDQYVCEKITQNVGS
jgi:hypothetical protein